MSRSLGIRCIFTLGKLGSVVSDGDEAAFVPSLKVNAVESTGAGDSFIGGLGYALLHEMELVEACRFATKCSAVTVCRYGAQPSMPTIDEIE
jgi:ribokinase